MKYQNPSLSAKALIRAAQAKNEQLLKNINDGFINLRNAVIRKELPENENSYKTVDTVEKIFNFNKQQNAKGIEEIIP